MLEFYTQRIESFLDVLLSNLNIMESEMEKAMRRDSLVVGDFDPKLQQAFKEEWPSDADESPGDLIGFDYYKAMRSKGTVSSAYIRKRYEEASRDMTGNGVIDFLHLVYITRKEAILIKNFIANRGDFLGTASEQVFENFEVWLQTAIIQTKRIYEDFKTETQRSDFITEADDPNTASEEARRSQALSKVSLNRHNSSIVKNLTALYRGFSDRSDVFYDKFLQGISDASEERLESLISDQRRRMNLYVRKIDILVDEISSRDDAKRRIWTLSDKGKSMPVYGPAVMVRDVDRSVELQHRENLALDTGEFEWLGKHSSLPYLDKGDPHSQYLLKDGGGTVTGDITFEDKVTFDGVDPSEHRHTGEDGTFQIHGDDLIKSSLYEEAVDTEDKPLRPENLTVSRTDATSVPPGVNVIDTFFAWDSSDQYWHEIEVRLVADRQPVSTLPDPWAWYRSDDLDNLYSDGDVVTVWPDRMGDKDLLLGTSRDYDQIYKSNVVDGHGGIAPEPEHSGFGNHNGLQADSFGEKDFSGGFTIAGVVIDDGGTAQQILGLSISSGHEFTIYDTYVWGGYPYSYFESVIVGFAGEGGDVYLTNGDVDYPNRVFAQSTRMGPDISEGYLNSLRIPPEPTFPEDYWITTEDQAGWDSLLPCTWLYLRARPGSGQEVGGRIVEWVIYDQVFDDSQMQLLHDYLEERYPSIYSA